MQWSVQITGSRNCTGTVIGSVKGFRFNASLKNLALKNFHLAKTKVNIIEISANLYTQFTLRSLSKIYVTYHPSGRPFLVLKVENLILSFSTCFDAF